MKNRWPPTNLTRDADYIIQGTIYEDLLRAIYPPRPNSRILEVGCGTGKFGMCYALNTPLHVTLLDIDPAAIRYSKLLYEFMESMGAEFKGTIEWLEGSALELPLSDSSYHFVYAEQVLHKWALQKDKLDLAINEMARVTSLIACVILPDGEDPETIRYYEEIDRNEYPYHGAITSDELRERMTNAGLIMSQMATIHGHEDHGGLIGGIGWTQV